MYKVEPAVADGGEVIIYAPHITEVSYTHGPDIDKIGYHCRDYFVKQWEKFKYAPRSVLAHSTHLKGKGTYDAETSYGNSAHYRNARHRYFGRAMSQAQLELPGPQERRSRELA